MRVTLEPIASTPVTLIPVEEGEEDVFAPPAVPEGVPTRGLSFLPSGEALTPEVRQERAAKIPGQIIKEPVREVGRAIKGIARGAAGTVEGMAGGAQWLTEGAIGKDLADKAKGWAEWLSPEATGKKSNFRDVVYGGAGSMATFFIPGLGVSKGVGALAKVSPKIAAWAGAGAGGTLEAMTEGGQVYRDVLGKTGDIREAEGAATETFWWNVPLIVLTNKIGIFGESGGPFKGAVVSSQVEGFQEAAQEYISSNAKGEKATFGDMLTSYGVGAITGGPAGAISRIAQQRAEIAPEAPTAPVESIAGEAPAAPPEPVTLEPVEEVSEPVTLEPVEAKPDIFDEISPEEAPTLDELAAEVEAAPAVEEPAKKAKRKVEYEGKTYEEPMPGFWRSEAEGLEIVKMQVGRSKALAEQPQAEAAKGPSPKEAVPAYKAELKKTFPEADQEDVSFVAERVAQKFDDIAASTKGQKSGTAAGTAKAWRRFAETGVDTGVKGGTGAFNFGVRDFENEMRDYLSYKTTYEGDMSPRFLYARAKEGEEGAFSALADKQPRVEIDDSKAIVKIKPQQREGMRARMLDEVVDHPELFERYPDTKNIRVEFTDDPGKAGSYSERAKTIQLSRDAEKETLLHEIQHAIQEKEGFAKGGTVATAIEKVSVWTIGEGKRLASHYAAKGMKSDPAFAQFYEADVVEEAKRLIRTKTDAELDASQKILESAEKKARLSGREAYTRLAGEVEARDVSARADLTKEERRRTKPYTSEEIPVEEMIVDMKGGRIAERAGERAPITPTREQFERVLEEEAPPRRPLTVDSVQSMSDIATKGWKNKPGIKTVQTEKDLPAHIKEFIASEDGDGGVEGVFDPRTQSVYLVADNIKTPERIVDVVFHETLGHYGLRGTLRKDINPVLDQVYTKYRAEAREIAGQYGINVKTKEGQREAAEEVLARVAQDGTIDPTLWEKVVAAVRKWAKKAGLKMELSDNDIRGMIADAAKFVKEGKAKRPLRPGQPALSRAPRPEGKAGEAKLPKYAKSINLDRIEGKHGAKKLILEVSKEYEGKIDAARRGKINHEMTRAMAEDLGMTEKQLLKRRKGKALNAEEGLAARDILNASAHNLKDLEKRVADSDSNENLAAFKIALDKHAAIQAEVSGIATEAGRALSAHRIKSAQDARMTKNYQRMIDVLGGRDMNEEILKYFAEVDKGSRFEVNKFVAEMSQATTSDMVFEAWVNFLLSGPPTQIVNITSNALTFLTKMPEETMAATIDMFRAGITRTPRQRFYGEMPHNIYGAWQGLKEGTRAALNTFATEIPSEGHSKLEYARQQAIPSKVFKRGQKKKTLTIGGKEFPIPFTGEVQLGGRQIRIPGRGLMAMDEFFKAINYSTDLHSQAYRQAAKEGVKGEARAERIAELINNPTEEMTEHAKGEMLYRVFQKDLGPSGKAIQQWRSQTPVARYVVPFLRTPINIAKYGLERTPLNYPRIIKNALQGNLKGGDLSDELARATIGSMIALLAFILGREEKITGGGPKDKTDRAALYRTGWQPYSIKVDGKYYSYGRLEPVGMVLGLSADASEIWNAMSREEEDQITTLITMSLMSVSKNLTSKTFLRGLSDALNAATDPTRYGHRWVKSLSGTVVPTGAAVLARAGDPYLREAQTILDGIKARIPGQSKKLPYRYDIWGKPIKRGTAGAAAIISPIYVSDIKDSKVDKEIVRLGVRIGKPSKKARGIDLTPDQYSELMEKGGAEALRRVERFVRKPIYPKIKDELKAKMIKKLYSSAIKAERNKLFLKIRRGEN